MYWKYSSIILFNFLLISNFHIQFIIKSTEPSNSNFSYSTNFSEILIIARKLIQNENLANKETFVLNFKKQPINALEGILLAKNLLRNIKKLNGTESIKAQAAEAELYKLKRTHLLSFIWNFSILTDSPTVFREFITDLLQDKLFGLNINIYNLRSLLSNNLKFEINNPRSFRGKEYNKNFVDSSNTQFKILKKTGKKIITKFSLDLIQTTSTQPRNTLASKKFQEKASKILIPEAFRFNTSRIVAVWSREQIISSRAHMIKTDPDIDKALCVWINSSFIICYLRVLFTTVQATFGHIYAWHFRVIPYLDFNNQIILNGLEKIFNKYQDKNWEPLPIQYEDVLNGRNLIRLKYDLEILEILTKAYNYTFDEKSFTNELINIYRELLLLIK